jgi:hypothetical protein
MDTLQVIAVIGSIWGSAFLIMLSFTENINKLAAMIAKLEDE